MEDKKIIDLFWERDEQGIAAASQKYGGYCMTIALNILFDRQDAEECVNDAYNRAWNSIPPNRPEHLRAFLGRLTRNAALDRLDYLHAARRDMRVNELVDELDQCLSTEVSAGQSFEDSQISRTINEFLHSLDPRCRQVFVRRYWYSDSIKEIAMRFGMTQSGVKSMLSRTRQKLRRHLTEEGINV